MKFGGLLKAPLIPIAIEETKPSRFICGVPECPDGRVVDADERYTTVECDTHEARTTHDTAEPVMREQQVIRVQDQWRQHGTAPPPSSKG